MNFRGFTLVEMMVSIAIFTAITSVAVFNNARFNSSILLTNLAYDVALSIRQAQVYGTTVKQDSEGSFNSGYGVVFSTGDNSYVLFEDSNTDGFCNNSSNDCSEGDVGEFLERYTMKGGHTVGNILIDGSPSQAVSISFVRPNPTSILRGDLGQPVSGRVKICLLSPDNLSRMVTVESSGQIGVSIPKNNECE